MNGYNDNGELPGEIRSALPPAAQDVWRVAYNSAVASHAEKPAEAAWAAVELGWVEWGGKWIPRKD